MISESKVHKSKGKTLFTVDVEPSRNMPGCLRNKKNMCLHLLTDFYLTHPSNKQIVCWDFEKKTKYYATYKILLT